MGRGVAPGDGAGVGLLGAGGALVGCEGVRSCLGGLFVEGDEEGQVSVRVVWMVWVAVWGGCGPTCSFCGGWTGLG